MKKINIISAVTAITFSIALAATAQEQKSGDNKNAAKTPQAVPAIQVSPQGMNAGINLASNRTEMLARALKLTDEQKEKARPIIEEETKKLQELRMKKDLTPQERVAKMREIREATYQKMKPILTEEQWNKFYRPMTNATAVPQQPQTPKQSPSQPANK
ncbi:MAG: hypothetical protein ACP5T0_02085 [Verrucomicrobiia bacterium]